MPTKQNRKRERKRGKQPDAPLIEEVPKGAKLGNSMNNHHIAYGHPYREFLESLTPMARKCITGEPFPSWSRVGVAGMQEI